MKLNNIEVPSDFDNPNWNKTEKCHDWKNYANCHVQNIWGDLNLRQMAAISSSFQEIADKEEYE